jgi:hypothetical protein
MTNPLFKGAVDLSKLNSGEILNSESKSEDWGHEIVDVLPSERIELMEVTTRANHLFRSTSFARDFEADPHKALAKYAIQVDAMFHEIGWNVFVDAFNVEEGENGKPYLSPTISVVSKVDNVEFDYDQARGETQSGLADGRIGRIMEDGTIRDPKSVI